MRYRIGDRVRITERRDVNLNLPDGWEPDAGKIGTIQGLNSKHWGRYEVLCGRGHVYYCKEEEIEHLDAPRIPFDLSRGNPSSMDNRWWSRRTWKRVVE